MRLVNPVVRACVCVVLAAIAAGGVVSEAEAVESETDLDAFYMPPKRLPGTGPGDLIRSEPITAPAGAKAWRVLYRSKSVGGDPIAVSGVVVAPGARARATRPVVTWAHGTTGLADVCAPSRFPDVASRIPYVTELVGAGYVVAASDYEGLGTPAVHPYLVGQSEGRGVLDAARAARALRGAGAGKQVVVMGHSQGGQAALFGGELAGAYARELALEGVVAIAPVTDLAVLLGAAASIPQAAGYAVMGATGFHAAYPDTDLDALLTPEATVRAGIVEDGCAGPVIDAYRGTQGPVFAQDPRTTAPWNELLVENTPGHDQTRAPILMVQGTGDTLVPSVLTSSFLPRLCDVGNAAEYRAYEGATHGSVLLAAHDDILAWLADRFDGVPAASGCA